MKPMIKFEVDKQVINMDKVPGNSGSVTDALKNTGVVEVDPQSNAITVRGQAVKLQMDGHPFEMPDNMLAQMPASMVDQVEVILSPSAKESAEGGTYILNLITKKNDFDNFNGSISLNTSTNSRNYGGININYKSGKFNFFTAFFGSIFDSRNNSNSEKFNYNSSNLYYLKSDNSAKYNGNSGYLKMGFDYDFDKSNSITFFGTYSGSKYTGDYNNNSFAYNNNLLSQYNYLNSSGMDYKWGVYSLYGFYKRKFEKKGEELTVDGYFTNISSPQTQELVTTYSYNQNYPHLHNTTTDESGKTFIFKADYTLPTDIGKFETGYNLTTRDRDNNYNALDYSYGSNTWTDSLNLDNLFNYKETVHALYLTYSNHFGKIGLKTGLRTEDLKSEGHQITTGENFSENFLSFFPNINISYKFNSTFQLIINAFRRVRYPPLYYVNPFKIYNGPNSYSTGNPSIKPYFINSYSISLSQYINAYYVFSTGLFETVRTNVDDSVSYSSPINFSSSKTYGFELTLPYYNSPSMPIHLPDFISMLNIKYGYNYRKRLGTYLNEDLSDWGNHTVAECKSRIKFMV